MLTYWSHIFTCLTSSECRSRNRFLCQFVWTTETVPILYNWLLQQFSFNIIETLHSDCTHIEDCIFYFGRFPHFFFFFVYIPSSIFQTDSIIPIDDFWWLIIIFSKTDARGSPCWLAVIVLCCARGTWTALYFFYFFFICLIAGD